MSPQSDRERSPNYQHYNSITGNDDGGFKTVSETKERIERDRTSNEYVLGVAFWSFVLFTVTQTLFSIIANSQAMLTDSQAMYVDALTYLFNLIAERLKKRSFSEEEIQSIPPEVLSYRRERLRLYLELFPPLISAVILMVVTFSAFRDAIVGLSSRTPQQQVDVNVDLMLIFSFINLLLDVLNVSCFASAHQAFGLGEVEKEEIIYSAGRREDETSENTTLLNVRGAGSCRLHDLSTEKERKTALNLNMCSAWTHVMADTLRSVAVLIAAFIALCFDAVEGSVADLFATLVVSVIILFSLLPLIHGLYATIQRIVDLRADVRVIDV